jgi:hypothetical protein
MGVVKGIKRTRVGTMGKELRIEGRVQKKFMIDTQ